MPSTRPLSPAQVGEILGVPVDEVIALIMNSELRGARVGHPPAWRIEAESVTEYLDNQAEEARRMALWQQSHTASFPELWGRGAVRHPD